MTWSSYLSNLLYNLFRSANKRPVIKRQQVVSIHCPDREYRKFHLSNTDESKKYIYVFIFIVITSIYLCQETRALCTARFIGSFHRLCFRVFVNFNGVQLQFMYDAQMHSPHCKNTPMWDSTNIDLAKILWETRLVVSLVQVNITEWMRVQKRVVQS